MRPLVFIFSPILSSQLFGQKPVSAVEPSWITRTTTDNNPDARLLSDTKDGYINLVLERQVNLASQTTYYRNVLRMVTEAGVQNKVEKSLKQNLHFFER